MQNDLVSRDSIAPLPYFHPSYEALLYAPFSLLPYQAAYVAFELFNFFLLLRVFYSSRSLFSTAIPLWQPRPGLLLLPFLPMLLAVFEGQNSILVLLLCCLTWTHMRKGNRVIAGIFLALGLFKFQIILPIALLLVVRYGRRFATGFAATGTTVALLSVALVGWPATVSLIRLLRGASLATDQSTAMQHALSIHPLTMPNLNGLLFAAGTRFLQPQTAFLLLATVTLGLLAWCALAVRRASCEAAAFSIAILCGLLVSSHLYPHDTTLLLLPVALIGFIHQRIMASLYAAPPLLFFLGLNWLFLFTLPILALLLASSQTMNEYDPPPPVDAGETTTVNA